jgi:hypothetical protein
MAKDTPKHTRTIEGDKGTLSRKLTREEITCSPVTRIIPQDLLSVMSKTITETSKMRANFKMGNIFTKINQDMIKIISVMEEM